MGRRGVEFDILLPAALSARSEVLAWPGLM